MFKTNSPNKLYLCHFKKSDVDMKTLTTITSVYHHIVKWLPYKPKQNSPTQCYRCCMYGHGASSCNRYQVCLLCSDKHDAKNCPQSQSLTPSYKCFNCASANISHNHKANDPNCPFRAKYELARNSAKEKNKRKPLTQKQNSSGPFKQQYVIAPPPLPLTASYASQFTQHSHSQASLSNQASSSSHTSQQSQAQQQQQQQQSQHQQTHTACDNNVNGNLWRIDEITNILITSIDELQQCKSKLEQLRIIAKLLRHACN